MITRGHWKPSIRRAKSSHARAALCLAAALSCAAPALADMETYDQHHSSTFRWQIFFTPCPVPNKTFVSAYAQFATQQVGSATRGGRDTDNNDTGFCDYISGRADAIPFSLTGNASACLTRSRPTWQNPPTGWSGRTQPPPPPLGGPTTAVATDYAPGPWSVGFNCSNGSLMAGPDGHTLESDETFTQSESLPAHTADANPPVAALEPQSICQTNGLPLASYECINYSMSAGSHSGSAYDRPYLGQVGCAGPYCFDCSGSGSGYAVDHSSGSISANELFRIALPENSWGQPRNLCLKLDSTARAVVSSQRFWKYHLVGTVSCPAGPACIDASCIGTPAPIIMKTSVSIIVKVYASSPRECAAPSGTPFFSRTYSGALYSGPDFIFGEGIFAFTSCTPCNGWVSNMVDCDGDSGTEPETIGKHYVEASDASFHDEIGFNNNTPMVIVIERQIKTTAGY